MKRIIIVVIVLLILAVIAIGMSRKSLEWPFSGIEPQAAEPLRLLSSLPVHDLILQEATFDIITKARLDKAGNPVLYFVSAGAFGMGDATLILFRGCVRVQYGLNLNRVGPDCCSVDKNVLTVRLPQPQIIGNPVILTDSMCESRILDVQGEGWWAGYVRRADIQTRIHQEYAKNAARLCEGLGMEQKTKERAEQVLRAFLQPVLNAQKLTLVIQWPDATATAEEQKSEQGMEKGTSDAVHNVEATDFAVADVVMSIGVVLRPGLPAGTDDTLDFLTPIACADDSEFAGDAQFGFTGEQVRGLPDGAFRSARPRWISAE